MTVEEMCRDIISISGGNLEMADFSKMKEVEIRILYFRIVQGCSFEQIAKLAFEKPKTRQRASSKCELAIRKLRVATGNF
jgi:hypothetical protein